MYKRNQKGEEQKRKHRQIKANSQLSMLMKRGGKGRGQAD